MIMVTQAVGKEEGSVVRLEECRVVLVEVVCRRHVA